MEGKPMMDTVFSWECHPHEGLPAFWGKITTTG